MKVVLLKSRPNLDVNAKGDPDEEHFQKVCYNKDSSGEYRLKDEEKEVRDYQDKKIIQHVKFEGHLVTYMVAVIVADNVDLGK